MLIRFLSIMYYPYAIAACVLLIVFSRKLFGAQSRKALICISCGIMFALTWRVVFGIGSKRYASIFIFLPVIALGYLSDQKKAILKTAFRITIIMLLLGASYYTFMQHNRYSMYTGSVAYTILNDCKKNFLSSCSILSFINKGTRVIYQTRINGICINDKVSSFPFSNLRLNINYWKYATDFTYFIVALPENQPPPKPEDVLLNTDQWKMIHASFLDNHKKKRAYAFKYSPSKDDISSFRIHEEIKNGSFEDVVKTTQFAYRLEPKNPDFYRTGEKKLYPAEWNILLDHYFSDGAKPEISCVSPGISGEYSLRLSSEKPIFIYNTHAIDLRQDVYLSFEAMIKKSSKLNVWLMTAGKQDQIHGCLHKKIAQIPFSPPFGSEEVHKFFFRLEPYNDGKNGWARIAFVLDYGEVVLDNVQLERKTEAAK